MHCGDGRVDLLVTPSDPECRPTGRMDLLSSPIVSALRDLLRIAKVAMPDNLYAIDPRIQKATELLANLERVEALDQSTPLQMAALDSLPSGDWDVSAALDNFMLETDAPATRPQAINLILRDWLVGHGYLEPTPDRDTAH